MKARIKEKNLITTIYSHMKHLPGSEVIVLDEHSYKNLQCTLIEELDGETWLFHAEDLIPSDFKYKFKELRKERIR